ncbi:MAG: N-acetyl-gamma-glutamyl-phosphate reductase [SAR324 cluster bacterium]|nr:N-acetyl-gamma-glutamyl-phosphate reductase [SAR324 cluster bacterium]MBL7034132.1 N-acetyl-gamma-glutamyl-phosphate reductase [SAR324 cluster bacterium]
MVRIGIIGAAGLSGRELLYLLQHHEEISVELVTSSKYQGQKVNDVFPELNSYTQIFQPNETDVSGCDLVFLAIPNQASLERVPKLLNQGLRVIDLSGAFRLRDTEVFSKYYQLTHSAPELLEESAFGLPEFFREKISAAKMVANPGCYATGALLGLLPLGELLGDLDRPPIIDAKSGVSGAGGRVEDDVTNYVSVNENFKAYKTFSHQHQPEIQQYLEDLSLYRSANTGEVVFTPHLLPLNRGILSTIYLHFKKVVSPGEIRGRFSEFAESQEFIHFLGAGVLPDLKMSVNSNRCMIGTDSDQTGKNWVIITSIDNLVKGASGQAIQNMNLMFGLNETQGLL